MRIPGCLILVLIFIVWLHQKLKKTSNEDELFWENERKADSVRKKSLDSLYYITIPTDSLPFFYDFDKKLEEIQEQIMELSSQKIVNLTGISNTQLKLDYGTANLPILSEYDASFTLLARTVYNWGLRLHELEKDAEAITVLEFGVSCKTDIYKHYMLLGELYVKHGQAYKLYELISVADSLQSLMKEGIVRDLKVLSDSSV